MQFVPTTDVLRDEGFDYTDTNSKEKIKELYVTWNELDYIIIDEDKIIDSTDNYHFWVANRVRNVAALKDWIVDPKNFKKHVKEGKLVEKYRDLLNKNIRKFNDKMDKMQTELESQKWIIEMQEEMIEEAKTGK